MVHAVASRIHHVSPTCRDASEQGCFLIRLVLWRYWDVGFVWICEVAGAILKIHHFTSSFRWSLHYIDHYTMLIYANLFIHQKKTSRKALSIFGGSSREYFRASGKALGGTVAVRTFQYVGVNLWSTSENYTVYQFIPSIVFWQQKTVAFKQCPQNKDNNKRKVFKTKQIKQQNISDMCSPWVFKGCLQPFSTSLQCWKSRIRSASRRRHYQSLDLQEQHWLLWKITEFQPISSNQKKQGNYPTSF